MGFQISLCKFHKTSPSERLLEEKAVTLWDELTEQKAVSQKTSFQFLTEDISYFTIALYGLPNITLQILQEQPSRKTSWEESCNSVRWINRTQNSFSERLFPVFMEDISCFTIALYGFQISLFKFHNNSLRERLLDGKSVTLKWIKRTQSSFSGILFLFFNGKYFLFHLSPLWASKYHLVNSTRRVLAKGFLRR